MKGEPMIDKDDPSECFDRGYLGGSLQGHADGYEQGYADGATAMRDKCLEKVRAIADEWDNEANAAFARRDLSAEVRLRTRRDAARAIVTELTYVTLDQPVEKMETKQ